MNDNNQLYDEEAYWQYLIELSKSIQEEDIQYADTKEQEATHTDGVLQEAICRV